MARVVAGTGGSGDKLSRSGGDSGERAQTKGDSVRPSRAPRTSSALIESDQFETPDHIFLPLQTKYRFNLDLAATKENSKCGRVRCFTAEDSALTKDWAEYGGEDWMWCNPPYSKPNLHAFTEKARQEVVRGAALVMLVPATPGAGWFQNHIFFGHDLYEGGAVNPNEPMWLHGYELKLRGNGYLLKVRFLRKRVSFWQGGKPSKHGAATDSCLIEWRPRRLT